MAPFASRRCPNCGEVRLSPQLERVPPEPGYGTVQRVRCPDCGYGGQAWAFRRAGRADALEPRPFCRGARPDGVPCGRRAKWGNEYCAQHDPDAAPQVPRCRICRDPLLAEIEAALAGGTRFPEITARFGVPERTVRYHRARHMPPAGVELRRMG